MSKQNIPKLPSPSGRGSGRGRTVAIQAAVVVVLVALVAVIGFSVAHKKQNKDAQAAAITAASAGPAVFHNDALRFGNTAPNAKVVLTLQEDFQCPACKEFETVSGPYIAKLIQQRTVAVDYAPVAILDNESATNYSSRADNASACIADADKSKWLAWHALMYQRQPQEGSSGLTDGQLVDIAKQAGLTSPAVASCITSGKYAGFVQASTQRALAHKIDHTPTIKVNGTDVTDTTPGGLQAAIDAARNK